MSSHGNISYKIATLLQPTFALCTRRTVTRFIMPCTFLSSDRLYFPACIFLDDNRDIDIQPLLVKDQYKRRIPCRGEAVVAKISNKMRALLGSIVLATFLASCFAGCRPGLNGRQDWYQCEGLSDLSVSRASQ